MLFIIEQTWKQPRCPSTEEWIKKMWYIYIMVYYSAEKNNNIMKFAGKWKELENIILSEVTQTQKDKHEGTSEVADSGKKKIEKSEKENKVPTRQENLHVYNVTKAEKSAKIPNKVVYCPYNFACVCECGKHDTEDSKDASTSKKDKEDYKDDHKDVPASRKDKELTDDVSSPKKSKNPISFFQCVYLDGYNGYGFQFPVTPAQRPGENSGKPNSPGQKQGQ
ncbi:hypothetical protein STEG23_016231 [Scotinomys teguina]